MLDKLLKEKHCFKLILGAGNENLKEIKHLVALYSMAGCRFFDLCADKDVILSAKNGLKYSNKNDCYLCVSVGLKGDPHLDKAFIDSNCISCQKCENICLERAIKDYKINQKKCIGCARCTEACPVGAIKMQSKPKDLKEILPSIIDLGIDCIEFHASSNNDEEVYQKWADINELYDGMLGICITLQAVATSEIIQNQNYNAFLLLSGGTNSKTAELAKMCNINYSGISMGSFARKIVKEYVERDDFLENKEIFSEALKIVKELVDKCLA